MTRTLDSMLEQFSPEERATIKRDAEAIVAQNRTLTELRKDLGITQAELAQAMGTTQGNVAQIEAKDDVMISTIARVVEALGGRLSLLAELPGRDPVRLALRKGARTRRPKRNAPSVADEIEAPARLTGLRRSGAEPRRRSRSRP